MSAGKGGGGATAESLEPNHDDDVLTGGGASLKSALVKLVRVFVCFISNTLAWYAADRGTTGDPPTLALALAASSCADVWSS
jgi:hypothetical protein